MSVLFLTPLLLSCALSLDALAASFAYGTDQITVPVSSRIVICLICSGTLGITLWLGQSLRPFLPNDLTKGLSFFILFLLGAVRLCDSWLKAFLKHRRRARKELHVGGVRFILDICADSTAADADKSRRLSPAEAASLSLALSLDGMAAGFGAGLSDINIFSAICCSLLITFLSIVIGVRLGKLLSSHLTFPLGWISGAMLLVLAVLRLI